MDLIVFNLFNLTIVCSGLRLDSPLKRDSLCETVNCKQTKKPSASDCCETGVHAGASRLPDLSADIPAEKQAAALQPQ